MKEKTCCFTGHRPQKLSWGNDESHYKCVAIKSLIMQEIYEAIIKGYRHFICGMALGIDTYCAEIVISAKKTYSMLGITLEGAIPFPMQDQKWSTADKARYKALLAECDKISVLSKEYSAYCMAKRNQYMVDNSSMIIAVCNENSGGSAKTLEYARKNNLDVRHLLP